MESMFLMFSTGSTTGISQPRASMIGGSRGRKIVRHFGYDTDPFVGLDPTLPSGTLMNWRAVPILSLDHHVVR